MSRLDVMKARFKAAAIIMGEQITYNNNLIYATPELGATLDKNTNLDAAALADLALFTVSVEDVPSPTPGDAIIYDGKTYKVSRIQLADTMSGQFVLETMANSRGFKK